MRYQHFTHVTTAVEAGNVLEAMNTALDMKIYGRQAKSMMHLLICVAGLGFVILMWCSGEVSALSEAIAVMFVVFAVPAYIEMIHSRPEEENKVHFPLRREIPNLSDAERIEAAEIILNEYNKQISAWKSQIEAAERRDSCRNSMECTSICHQCIMAELTGE